MSAIDTLFQLAPQLLDGMKSSSGHVMIRCPFHSGGQEKTPSCSISAWKPVFHCHSCKESGHLSRLLRHFGLSKSMIDAILPRDESYQKEEHSLTTRMVKGLDPFRGRYILDEEVLDYYRLMPKSLKSAGFKINTLRHFEVGYDDRNLRITYPLRSVFGELLGISGGTIIKGTQPKYRLYEQELKERKDIRIPADYSMEESKSAVLWHAHIVRPLFFLHDSGKDTINITEGFKACMWTYQAGLEDTVALVGSYLTDVQAELIARATRKATLFLDNNEAGIKGTFQAGRALLKKGVEVSCATYPDDREQPDNLTPQEVVDAVVVHKQSFRSWLTTHEFPDSFERLNKKRWH